MLLVSWRAGADNGLSRILFGQRRPRLKKLLRESPRLRRTVLVLLHDVGVSRRDRRSRHRAEQC